MIARGLKGITCTETKMSFIDGEQGRLIYRGYDAADLAQTHSFEEVAYLLWYGTLPNQEQLIELKKQFQASRKLPDNMKSIIASVPHSHDMLSVLRTALSSVELTDENQATITDAISLTSLTPAIIAYRQSLQQDIAFPEERSDLDHVAYYLYMITGKEPSKAYVQALETYMILTMEHGLNASTFSARVTASTESDIASAITSAVGTMKGPLHGGAPSGVIELLNESVQQEDIREFIREKVQQGEKLMGFGHRVYKTWDPRAQAIKKILQQQKQEDDWFDLALNVEEASINVLEELKPGRNLYTNVEFYAAAILRELTIPTNLFTATFTASRMVGWTAHVMEQLEDNTIFRPSAEYVGPFYS
ncbi:citrate synthase/methylcitrate synthase [Pontibacillus yanchengensis]|uniref:Citrate synthase n=1 Tax=Pontibacillus yanchengensis Y32 TaxID=1385514 RepID=A0A0A2TJL8_9BACI|nr:citrate synthase/methylcitrate synthase [Pontibacillus yanchengensis]KGP74271.1 citrate synthase [Pontibacillus yanchengensis Y32]